MTQSSYGVVGRIGVLTLLVGLVVGCGQLNLPKVTSSETSSLSAQGSKENATITVNSSKELLITDLSVIEDPVRTVYTPSIINPSDPRGAWSFGRLMENLAGRASASSFALHWLESWDRDQNIGGFVSPARPLMRSIVTDPWRVASGCTPGTDPCALDFAKAPFRLTAIVSRLDLRDFSDEGKINNAGEGRFVFNFLRPDGTPLAATVIFEFELQAKKDKEVLEWASSWHTLGSLLFGPGFNAQLQQITQNYSGRFISDKPSGSALNQLRTNEASLAPAGSDPANLPSTKLWEMREFNVLPSGQLEQVTVKQTPDLSLNGSSQLAGAINANEAEVLNAKFNVPASMLGASSLIAKTLAWTAPGTSEAARKNFAVNTCSGCHLSETGTAFLHIGRRNAGAPTPISAFLTGELALRGADLSNLLEAGKKGLKLPEGKRKDGKGDAD